MNVKIMRIKIIENAKLEANLIFFIHRYPVSFKNFLMRN